MEATVVGAGVVGLTAAVRLREAGVAADVWARESPEETTSAVAAAIWYPYLALPRDLVTGWAATSYRVFTALADAPGTGVAVRTGREVFREPVPDPWWRGAVPGFARCSPADPSDGLVDGLVDGYRFPTPIIDMSAYLPWLVDRFTGLGGTVERRVARSLDEVPGDVIVNATGLGARELVGDTEMEPVRGQVVRVEQVGLTEWLLDGRNPDGMLYVVPRERDIVLGGTDDAGVEDREPDPAVAEGILARCRAAVPALADARVLGHAVGLRPARSTVRLEAEPLADGRTVVHCYGHGGAGVTLSWGCADEVTRIARP